MARDEPQTVKIDISEQLGVSEVMIGTGEGPSGMGIRRVDSKGHSVGVDQRGIEVTEIISGPTVQNEQGTEETCQILMAKLNELGADWNRLQTPTEHTAIDGRLYSRRAEIKSLEIQVTKAIPEIWNELARRPEGIHRSREIDAICESLLDAIKGKQHISKGPRLVLALEAVHFPVPTAVAERFIEKYTHVASSVGFYQVWLVGPTPTLTFRLA